MNTCSANRLGTGRAKALLRCGNDLRKPHIEANFVTSQLALLYVFSGSGCYNDESGICLDFSSGSVIVRLPGVCHSLEFFEDSEIAYIAVPSEVLAIMRQTAPNTFKHPVFRSEISPKVVRVKHRDICDELSSLPNNRLFEVVVKMQDFIAMLCLSLKHNNMEQACRIIEENILNKISMPEIAAELKMSYSAFRKKFLQELGVPPGKYLINKRIEKAYELLLQGCPVGEVADQLNYPDIYTFSRQFKKHTGNTPSETKVKF